MAFAAFIGVSIWHAPVRPHAAAAATAPAVAAQDDESGSTLSHIRRSALPPPPPPNYTLTANLLAEAKGVTYIDEILAARGGYIARWEDRRENPVTVWIQPRPGLADFWPDFRNRARDAFYTWAAAGVPVTFSFIDDSTAAEVRVRWVNSFPEASGKTYWARDQYWWIVDADIELAVHQPNGQALDGEAIRAIALHEVGHLIGLDHSSNPDNIMSAHVHVRNLSAEDLRTASLIYKLPPGSVTPPGGTKP
jgi:hypothetical protein